MHANYVQPVTNCFRTKDGWWLLFLGADVVRHLPRMMKACGLGKMYLLSRLSSLPSILATPGGRVAKFSAAMKILTHDFKVLLWAVA